MTIYQFILSVIGVLMIPMLGLMVRIISKWTRVEERLTRIVEEMKKMSDEKEKTHGVIFSTISEDRKATNERLRWLEEHLWRQIPGSRKDAA